mmetsp:Transcript_5540/g.23495  ORF Transcript_5540/g.23495 Transcript_5540/m.23495 type:complete len:383 (+) Transcript_5540:223-1371(+)
MNSPALSGAGSFSSRRSWLADAAGAAASGSLGAVAAVGAVFEAVLPEAGRAVDDGLVLCLTPTRGAGPPALDLRASITAASATTARPRQYTPAQITVYATYTSLANATSARRADITPRSSGIWVSTVALAVADTSNCASWGMALFNSSTVRFTATFMRPSAASCLSSCPSAMPCVETHADTPHTLVVMRSAAGASAPEPHGIGAMFSVTAPLIPYAQVTNPTTSASVPTSSTSPAGEMRAAPVSSTPMARPNCGSSLRLYVPAGATHSPSVEPNGEDDTRGTLNTVCCGTVNRWSCGLSRLVGVPSAAAPCCSSEMLTVGMTTLDESSRKPPSPWKRVIATDRRLYWLRKKAIVERVTDVTMKPAARTRPAKRGMLRFLLRA